MILDGKSLSLDFYSEKFKYNLDKCQKILLKCMYDLENNKFRIVNNEVITTNTAIICEKLSIGKTITLLALLFMDSSKFTLTDTFLYNNSMYLSNKINTSNLLLEQINLKQCNWNIILCNQNGITTYIEYMKKYIPSMKYQLILNFNDIHKISYDYSENIIILIKLKKGILKEFRDIHINYKFKRLIIDNLYELKLSYDDITLPANFIWILTTKIKKTYPNRRIEKTIKKNSTISVQHFMYKLFNNKSILQLCSDPIIQDYFTIRFNYSFLKEEFKLPLIKSYNLIVKYSKIELLKEEHDIYLDINEIKKEITLLLPDNLSILLSNEKIKEVAEALGICCNSVSELYLILLDSMNDYYINLDNYIKKIDDLLQKDLNNSKDNAEYLKQLYNFIEISSPKKIKRQILTIVNSKKFTKILELLKYEFKEKQHKIINPLNRLINNIKDLECQCCFIPFDYDINHIFIINCCHIILCIDCIFLDNKKLISKCPKCMTPVKSIESFTYINFDINNIINYNVVSMTYHSIINKSNPIRTLINTINGNINGSDITIALDNIKWLTNLIGDADLPNNPSRDSGRDNLENILIYTSKNYLYLLEKEINSNISNTSNIQIQCNPQKITNPKEITKLIFYGKITLNEKKKVIECIQKLGRTCNLMIYRITIEYI